MFKVLGFYGSRFRAWEFGCAELRVKGVGLEGLGFGVGFGVCGTGNE